MINYVLSKDKTYYTVNAVGFTRPEGVVLILNTYNGLPVKEIVKEAFIACTNVEKVIIGANVEKIGDGAFKNCINLRDVDFPKSLKEIGEQAFLGCSSLLEAMLPEGLKTIGLEAFLGCKNLIKLKIPSTLESGGYTAFAGCKKIVGFSTIDGIDSKDFIKCSSFYKSAIEISKNLEYNNVKCDEDGFIFYSTPTACVLLGHRQARQIKGDVKLPSDFRGNDYFISPDAFYGANKITSVVIPDGVSAIGDGAFYYCYRLKNINVPTSIKKIGVDAFFGCAELNSVEMINDKKWQVKKSGDSEFKVVDEKFISTNQNTAKALTKKYLNYEWRSLITDDTIMKKY